MNKQINESLKKQLQEKATYIYFLLVFCESLMGLCCSYSTSGSWISKCLLPSRWLFWPVYWSIMLWIYEPCLASLSACYLSISCCCKLRGWLSWAKYLTSMSVRAQLELRSRIDASYPLLMLRSFVWRLVFTFSDYCGCEVASICLWFPKMESVKLWFTVFGKSIFWN